MKFRGSGVALVTPFHADLTIDFSALKKLVNHVIDNGIDYLVALGTTSEAPTLTKEEKKLVLNTIIEENKGRVPVVCGIGGNNTAEVIAQIAESDLSQVDAILSVAPYYNKPTQEGVYRHFRAIAESTDKDIILYNVPGRTVTNISAATTLQLAKECANIVAIKEATGDMGQCMHLVQDRPEGFTILSGDDALTPAQLAIGFDGVISVSANCYTRTFTDMVNAGLNSDFELVRKLHYQLLRPTELLFAEGNPAGVKAALAHMGILENYLRLPLVAASDELLGNLKGYALK